MTLISHNTSARGNVLFMILIVIVLTGLLTIALQSTSQTGNENIDRETLIIRAAEVQQYAGEIETALHYIFQNTASENDLRFAHPDAADDYGDILDTPAYQIFSAQGGGAKYKAAPTGLNDGEAWEFYGGTAMPGVGSDRPELVAVLPNVNQQFCDFINEKLGYDKDKIPSDTGACINEGAGGRFNDRTQFSSSPNTMDSASFSRLPVLKACVKCGGTFHYVHVLMAR